MANRGAPRDIRKTARLSMLNTFAARDRAFIFKLAKELHLILRWDDYDEEDQNLVTFLLPVSASDTSEKDDSSSEDNDEDWEDDSEGNAAVDRILEKYAKLKLSDADGVDSDETYEQKLLQKMDIWKRDYYRVREAFITEEMP